MVKLRNFIKEGFRKNPGNDDFQYITSEEKKHPVKITVIIPNNIGAKLMKNKYNS